VPSPGKRLAVVDLAQIEARYLLWTVGDEAALDQIRKGYSVYEAHAISSMGYEPIDVPLKKREGDEWGLFYKLAKARVLALGYGAGWKKFLVMVRTYGIDPEEVFATPTSEEDRERFLDYLENVPSYNGDAVHFKSTTDVEKNIWCNAWLCVEDFRKSNPKIVQYWRSLHFEFHAAAIRNKNYVNQLQSGRELTYFNAHFAQEVTDKDGKVTKSGLRAHTSLGDKKDAHYYGGKLAENYIQAGARDVFVAAFPRLEAMEGVDLLFHVHDEYVLDCEPWVTEQMLLDVVCTREPWYETLPLEAECDFVERYVK